MELVFFNIAICVLLFYKKIYGNFYFFLFFLLYLYLFIFFPITFYFFDDLGFLPGKPDQYGYYEFAKDYDLLSLKGLLDIAYQMNFHNFLYWQVYAISFKLSLISPVISMRLLNMIAFLLTGLFFYRSILLITKERNNAKIGTLFFLVSPTFLSFSLYVIRDILIVFFFSGAFYVMLSIYYNWNKKNIFSKIPILFMFSILTFSLRTQLLLVIFLLLFQIIIIKLLKVKRYVTLLIVQIILILLISEVVEATGFNLAGIYTIVYWIKAFYDWNFIWNLIIRIILYLVGLGFLDPTTGKTFSMTEILLTRTLSIDSLIVPVLFFIYYLKKFKKNLLINAVVFAFVIYFSIYTYAALFWGDEYGFHFRAMLPFFYIFYIFVGIETVPIIRKYAYKIEQTIFVKEVKLWRKEN